eukprot:TRINITY_DN7628_c0_g1_i2.p2 TRINITY_DN7628_c0_g1~~TRINITY_DN7628_c0_g1_i2.p2  ORF type:complete len:240 (-),score=-14.29 TRINITY_DN7628_c0_g1_i2:838-1557(-)
MSIIKIYKTNFYVLVQIQIIQILQTKFSKWKIIVVKLLFIIIIIHQQQKQYIKFQFIVSPYQISTNSNFKYKILIQLIHKQKQKSQRGFKNSDYLFYLNLKNLHNIQQKYILIYNNTMVILIKILQLEQLSLFHQIKIPIHAAIKLKYKQTNIYLYKFRKLLTEICAYKCKVRNYSQLQNKKRDLQNPYYIIIFQQQLHIIIDSKERCVRQQSRFLICVRIPTLQRQKNLRKQSQIECN